MKQQAIQYVALDVHQATLVVSVRDEQGAVTRAYYLMTAKTQPHHSGRKNGCATLARSEVYYAERVYVTRPATKR